MKTALRTAALATALLAASTLAGCAAAEPQAPADPEPSASVVEEVEEIEVDENLADVDITISRSLLDPDRSVKDADIIAGAVAQGYTARIEGDTVVFTMTKAQRDDTLTSLRDAGREAVDELIAKTDNSMTAVEHDDGLTHYTISVDASRYVPFEALYALAFYAQGAMYQQFAGVAEDDVDVIVEFVDDATGKVLHRGTYQEERDKLENLE